MSSMMKRITPIAFCLFSLGSVVNAQNNLTAKASSVAPAAAVESDRTRDGLVGPVRRVRTEVAKLSTQDGKPVETKHVVLEVVAYDLKGNKIENQYFPIAGSTLTGKEVYKYDDKGNISEMTLFNNDGSLLSKEIYKYEFDFAGNWNKMTTSVAVVDSGKLTFEPTEVTYRSIMYYLDENMVKMVTPGNTLSTQSALTTPPPPANTSTASVEPRPVRGNSKDRKTSPPLPSSTVSASNLTAPGAVDAKTMAVNPNSGAPVVNLDGEPPPSPGPKPILKPVSGGVLNGTAITLPPPVYPEPAKRMRTQGVVEVSVVLDETGKVISASAINGPTILREAAVQAALKARFSPTKLSGQPVKVSGTINYKFALVP